MAFGSEPGQQVGGMQHGENAGEEAAPWWDNAYGNDDGDAHNGR